jgi:hypothetical protein
LVKVVNMDPKQKTQNTVEDDEPYDRGNNG